MSAELTAHEKRTLTDVSTAIANGNLAQAEKTLVGLMALDPARREHPDVLRTIAAIRFRQGDHGTAVELLRAALAARPDDLALIGELVSALYSIGDHAGVLALQQRGCDLDPGNSRTWFNLGKAYRALGRYADSRAPLEKAIALEPGFAPMHVALGNTCKSLGELDVAEKHFRRAIEIDPGSGNAWLNLANFKTVRFDTADVAAMRHALAHARLSEVQRIEMEFALAKALDDIGDVVASFTVLVDANRRQRQRMPWSAAQFARDMEALRTAFANINADTRANELGSEVIFVSALPRSGSTLTEQILAAHPQVTGAGELDDLPAVIHAESARRNKSLLAWASEASADDWQRLGREYLQRTSRWREQTPIFTDKGMGNWPLVGAIRAMLPGARIVLCRRDPVETCLANFRHLFPAGHAFCYDLADCATYWHDFNRMCRHWKERFGALVYEQSYEALQADQEGETRRLLDYCGLPFDEACLRFYETERAVSTISAAQVREPMRRDTAKADRYGALLDPLRAAVAKAPE